MLKRHSVKGDGSCLYHAIAHQAGLITASSSGDELVSGHLRHLAFLTMLNFPAVQLETTMPQEEWLQKQKEILIPTRWGGDLEVRLLAIGLKRNITVIADPKSGSVFGQYFPCTPPPIPIIPSNH